MYKKFRQKTLLPFVKSGFPTFVTILGESVRSFTLYDTKIQILKEAEKIKNAEIKVLSKTLDEEIKSSKVHNPEFWL